MLIADAPSQSGSNFEQPEYRDTHVKLFTRKKRKNFYCRILGKAGRVVARSCYTRHRDMAEKVALSWERHFERERSNASGEAGSIIEQARLAVD